MRNLIGLVVALALPATAASASTRDHLAVHLQVHKQPLKMSKPGAPRPDHEVGDEDLRAIQGCKDDVISGRQFPAASRRAQAIDPKNPAPPLLQLTAYGINNCLLQRGRRDLRVTATPTAVGPAR